MTEKAERTEPTEPTEPTEQAGDSEQTEQTEQTEASHAHSGVDHETHESHGHSQAAWTGVTVILVGTLIMALAVIFPSVLFFVVGTVIAVLGVAAGKILAMAGYGAKASTRAAATNSGAGRADLPGRSQHDSGTQ